MSKKKEYRLSEEAYRNKLDYIDSYNKSKSRLTIQLEPEEKEHIKLLAQEKGMTIKELVMSAIKIYES